MRRIAYQQGQQGALEQTLRAYRDVLEYQHGVTLSKQPIEIDTLVIKKLADVPIEVDVGAIFRRYNIVEFKSPRDELCINQFSDLMTYIFRFQSKTGGSNEIKLDEITGTLFRSVRPKALFREFERLGGTVERRYEGIYYLRDFCRIPVQVIVGDELNPDRHAALRVVSDRATLDDIRRFIQEISQLTDSADRNNADAVLQVSIRANEAMYERVKEEQYMCEALEELMADAIEKKVRQGRKEGMEKGIFTAKADALKNIMETLHLSLDQAMAALKIPPEEKATFASLI